MIDEARDLRLLYWCETTARLPFATGIQRVVKRVGSALETAEFHVVPVGWDHGRRVLRLLSQAERLNLGFAQGVMPLLEHSDGRGKRSWLVLPEMPSVVEAVEIGRAYGCRTAAIVHDLIPLKPPHLYPPDFIAFHERYALALSKADLVITTTAFVASDFRAFLTARGMTIPPIVIVPLGGDGIVSARPVARAGPGNEHPLAVLMIATLEPRKNHLRVLNAMRHAGKLGGRAVTLTIAGRRGFHPAYDDAVRAAAHGQTGVVLNHGASDRDLARLFETHHATIYASYEEGFGLPILESSWAGLPCLCHDGSAMREIAPGGGTVMVDMLDETAIAHGLKRLADEPDTLETLRGEASRRPIRAWAETTRDMVGALVSHSA